MSPPPIPSSTIDSPARTGPQAAAPRRGALAACRHGARGALQWRLLLWWTILLLLPTLVAALPVWALLAENLDYSPFAARLAARLDLLAIADLVTSARERHGYALAGGAGVALVLTLLLSPLLAAMSASVSVSVQAARPPLAASALLAAGAHGYLRMLRMLVWAAAPFGIAAVLGGLALHAAGQAADAAVLQADGERAAHLAQLAAGLLALLAHATLDMGRALLAAEPQRRSAVLAWFAGCRRMARSPLALFGAYLALTAPGLLLAGALLLARMHMPALGAAGTIGACALTVPGVAVLGWMRAARLLALIELVRVR